MAATVASVITDVRTYTAHDNDTQVTDTQLTAMIAKEFKALRRQLAAVAPALFQATATATIANGGTSFNKPTDYDRLLLLERSYAGSTTYYYPLAAVPPLSVSQATTPTFYETPSTFVIKPDSAAPGNYRITYVALPTSGYTTLEGIPDGYEHIVVMRVCATVARRHEEDASHYLREADEMLREAKAYLRKRSGYHGQPVLGTTTAW